MIGRAGLGHSTARLQIDERECRQTAYLRQVISAAASRKPLHAELSRLEPIREHGSATIEVARTVVVERVERGYPMVPDDAAPVDRGHVIPHLSGGEFGPTEIGMRKRQLGRMPHSGPPGSSGNALLLADRECRECIDDLHGAKADSDDPREQVDDVSRVTDLAAPVVRGR